MKKYQVRLQGETKDDMENIRKYKGRYSSSAPSRIVAKILDRLDDLSLMPYSGRASDYDQDYRQIPVEDYMVLYRVDDDRGVIEIHYILHQSRNIERIIKTGDRSFKAGIDTDDEEINLYNTFDQPSPDDQ